MLDQSGAALHPIAVVIIFDALDIAELGGMDVAADNAVDAARACRLGDHFLEPADELDRVHELRAGAVTLRIVKACTRCTITTTDQQIGAVDGVDPLQTLKGYRFDKQLRGVAFGQNVIIVGGVGETLRVGQTFDVVWK